MLPGITIDHGLTNNFLHLCSLLFGRQECRFERLLLHLPSLLVNTVLENGIPQGSTEIKERKEPKKEPKEL